MRSLTFTWNLGAMTEDYLRASRDSSEKEGRGLRSVKTDPFGSKLLTESAAATISIRPCIPSPWKQPPFRLITISASNETRTRLLHYWRSGTEGRPSQLQTSTSAAGIILTPMRTSASIAAELAFRSIPACAKQLSLVFIIYGPSGSHRGRSCSPDKSQNLILMTETKTSGLR